jgi:hypothetical protein
MNLTAMMVRLIRIQEAAGSNPVASTIFLASLICGSFWGFAWFNRKVKQGEPRPENPLDKLSNFGPAVRPNSEGRELGPPEDR